MHPNDVLQAARVVPVVEIEDSTLAVPLAEALLEGGIPAIEVTLRTPAGLQSITEISRAVPGITVGAGTILTPEQAEEAIAAGAHFLVSPGFVPEISQAAAAREIPLYPGAVTASEVMQAMQAGHRILKFFPAEASGGLPVLKSLAGPLAHTGLQFMPTGGINPENLAEYLSNPAVIAVGGTWIAGRADISAGEFEKIRATAAVAVAIAQAPGTDK
ncbi:MAG: bifunctional 4-hydroxy-2-oxoglutarate aldolase/2-dehydro-3-deoxy-phosphogluconate aldolase [Leucobacter sp.]